MQLIAATILGTGLRRPKQPASAAGSGQAKQKSAAKANVATLTPIQKPINQGQPSSTSHSQSSYQLPTSSATYAAQGSATSQLEMASTSGIPSSSPKASPHSPTSPAHVLLSSRGSSSTPPLMVSPGMYAGVLLDF